jgi:transcriptional regulator with XRE-family HTH domain
MPVPATFPGMELQEALGRIVRAHRERSGKSQEKFAISVGIDRTVWTSIETGRRNLSLKSLERLAKALGMEVSELIREAEIYGRSTRGKAARS